MLCAKGACASGAKIISAAVPLRRAEIEHTQAGQAIEVVTHYRVLHYEAAGC